MDSYYISQVFQFLLFLHILDFTSDIIPKFWMLVSLKDKAFRKFVVNTVHKLHSQKYENYCCSYKKKVFGYEMHD